MNLKYYPCFQGDQSLFERKNNTVSEQQTVQDIILVKLNCGALLNMGTSKRHLNLNKTKAEILFLPAKTYCPTVLAF